MSKRFMTAGFVVAAALFVAVTYGAVVSAADPVEHRWGNYHWASDNVVLTVGTNFSGTGWGNWDSPLGPFGVALSDWNQSSVLALTPREGDTSSRRCRPANGTIEVCSHTYGNNGWLGVAGISVSGNHIVKAYAKMNDTYYCEGCSYDTPAWRALVMCQEVGHDFGLSHQDENFNNENLDTCMDYTSSPESNQQPNDWDYEVLRRIYDNHTVQYAESDGGSTGGGPCRGGPKKCGAAPPPAFDMELSDIGQWGQLLGTSQDGGQSTFVQDFGNGHRIYTHVTWTLEVAEQLRGRR